MALPPQFLDELRARTPMQGLVGRRVKLGKSGRNWKGCCPFHGEKTPSFYVYDDHFHCFGCGAHGDAITFWMQATGASFPEAVETLAAEAGLEVPKASPAQVRAEQRRLDLHGVLDLAQARFERLLHAQDGAPALAYLRGRGLSDETIARFGLGWSGDGRGGLLAELREAGVDPERALEAGLLREAEDGTRRELYWGRITFPIRDRRGRLISFGGRALADVKPKYINGPDTPIFPKRRTLYGLDLARDRVRAGKRLVVVEGYMDVIAMSQADIEAAVAPLGTALTEEQLAELWRLSPEPVLCFDGDAAGAAAAERAIKLALPMLQPGDTLRIAMLPGGEDPDSLLRKDAGALRAAIKAADTLIDALFRALARGVGAEPEQRAMLRVRLEAAAKSIPDRILSSEYRSALLQRFFGARKSGRAPAPRVARSGADWSDVQERRAMLLIAIMLKHPAMLHHLDEEFHRLALSESLDGVRNEMSAFAHSGELDSASLVDHLNNSDVSGEVERVLSATSKDLPECARADAMPIEVQAGWWHFYRLLTGPARLEEDIAYARLALEREFTQPNQDRLLALRYAQLDLTEFPELN